MRPFGTVRRCPLLLTLLAPVVGLLVGVPTTEAGPRLLLHAPFRGVVSIRRLCLPGGALLWSNDDMDPENPLPVSSRRSVARLAAGVAGTRRGTVSFARCERTR